MIYILLWASIFQFAAAVLALRLIRITQRRVAWSLITIALALMTVRRALPFYRLLFHDAPMPLDFANEIVGMAISFLMMLGVASIAPLFAAFKRAGDAVYESEMKFRTIANFTSDWQYWITTEGRFIYTTPSCEKITGYRYDEFISTPSLLETIVHPEDYAVIEQHRQLLNSTASHAMDFRIVTRDCEVRWIAHTCQPVFDDNGTLLGRCASNRDITGRKKDEEDLRRSEEKFRSIVDASPAAMHLYRLEPDGRLVLAGANPAADRLLGISHKSLAGRTIEEAFPLLAGTQIPMIYRRVARGELGSQSFELPYQDRRFGGIYDVTAFQTGPGNVAVAFVDISDRKRAEEELSRHRDHLEELVRQRTAELQAKNAQLAAEVAVRTQAETALRKSEERFAFAMQGANDGIWDWNLETDEVYYSPRWKNMLGYADDELESRLSAWERLVVPQDLERALEAVRAYLEGRTGRYEIEFRMVHKDGHLVDVLARALAVRRSSDGKPLRLVGTHVDITERKRVEDELRKKTAELETFNRTMIGREKRVIELKEEVNRLCAELKRAQAYPPVWRQ
jgi:PAS domain S-box-containing protein